ncbi:MULTISPECIES: glycerol-3-phosphate 1-O-acyltransferase PlsY [Bacillus]|jgi:acyl phosphate:glycerol-3-phosphate acyltransferase|uniref:glycerol-3-phosphate 1-O-acyltransferase PlsY n=1 Tax=Bacillus TaxID=1386 RepID=UPI002E2412AE|nr:glycerol-3-phosphate 1-O-acyltransferase PlsY [Bacillus smithii]MED1456172.1 glycerol-3-phosphate 1-O-acyltransferase PlsY [Bacillus smithii]MED1489932.1 glycerol-3-phosphate 1-O-acyltransferase PlsY [Bacillus smithii]MED4884020.1 glycerol-3-phosphate 1-O-acyltransferase PlsY [Bacillus smithii]MED4927839.1 glycerol-3-phosphate 1-O-acyltransferase PlsY [Bacillus smithii]
MEYVVFILIAYLLGSIPSGLIVGKIFYGVDIREHGSGNLGATNAFRTLGIKAGTVVIIADILKGTLATLLPIWFGADLHPLIAGMAAAIGHSFPIFAGFRGGKAVATSGGVLLAYEPVLFLLLVVAFLISLYISKYVSLSSIIVAIIAVIYTFFKGDIPLIIVVLFLASFVIFRHRANVKRILNKTEPKIKWM